MAGTSDLLREIADMLDAGFFKNITEDDLDRAKRVIMAFRDVNAKISRSGIPVCKERLYRYSDMVKIKNKEV